MTSKVLENGGAGDVVTIKPSAQLIQIEAPEDLFGKDRWVKRSKIIKMKWVRKIEATTSFDEMYESLAKMIPEWNLLDPETGDPLPNPKDDPMVFDELDFQHGIDWIKQVILNPPSAD